MREYAIAAIGADGIGPEVIAAGLKVLGVLARRDGGFALKVEEFPWGSDYYRKHGVLMPADGLDRLKRFDAIYFGAVGAPDIPDHVTLWGLRLPTARASTNTPMCGQRGSCPASPVRCATPSRRTSTGWWCARIPRANMPAMAGARIAAFPRRSRPRPRCSPAPASPASCASPSPPRARGRASS